MYTFYDLTIECIHSTTFYILYNIYSVLQVCDYAGVTSMGCLCYMGGMDYVLKFLISLVYAHYMTSI